ncbi:hypothetical protein [Brevibacillus antibioticus]
MLAQVLAELQESDLDVELSGFDLDEASDLINEYVNIEIEETI